MRRLYNEYATGMAKNELWNEAIFRWQQSLELDPAYAPAHNNLAVAYENQEKYEAAKAEYKKALELDPQNEYYIRNYQNFLLNVKRATKKPASPTP